MGNMRLIINHNGTIFEPPVESGVKIEWERGGSPGKLTFTTVKVPDDNAVFGEGDLVQFYYDEKPIFAGYVFKKSRGREHHVDVTCYDQIRYLKNKYTYVFEKKTATEIMKAVCEDFGLNLGTMDNTDYILQSVVEENTAAIDIILSVLEDTLTNTGNMYVIYDDFGKLCLRNCADMTSNIHIMSETAENFDYTSSIDDETYNEIVLYHKGDDNQIKVYAASSKNTIEKWGTLRYFEEVKNTTIAMNKLDALLSLYNKKTRELKVSGAFGSPDIRGGTLIPVTLDLGDIQVNNYMLVEKVTHTFKNDNYTMDLTLDGAWED